MSSSRRVNCYPRGIYAPGVIKFPVIRIAAKHLNTVSFKNCIISGYPAISEREAVSMLYEQNKKTVHIFCAHRESFKFLISDYQTGTRVIELNSQEEVVNFIEHLENGRGAEWLLSHVG